MGGEGVCPFAQPRTTVGSPPRGRGRQPHQPVRAVADGITPAWAGKARIRPVTGTPPRDHPRVGGEGNIDCDSGEPPPGSPPRGRGRHHSCQHWPLRGGITPAWAGKAMPAVVVGYMSWDHPRVGGEGIGGVWTHCLPAGSPPRGRGRLGQVLLYECVLVDHPRVGGEGYSPLRLMSSGLGSPPRGRGRRQRASHAVQGRGITPAWAGKAPSKRASRSCPRDHPRVGGEGIEHKVARRFGVGSPPRGRGRRSRGAVGASTGRITPAWAGKASDVEEELWLTRDHPRVGGEGSGPGPA